MIPKQRMIIVEMFLHCRYHFNRGILEMLWSTWSQSCPPAPRRTTLGTQTGSVPWGSIPGGLSIIRHDVTVAVQWADSSDLRSADIRDYRKTQRAEGQKKGEKRGTFLPQHMGRSFKQHGLQPKASLTSWSLGEIHRLCDVRLPYAEQLPGEFLDFNLSSMPKSPPPSNHLLLCLCLKSEGQILPQIPPFYVCLLCFICFDTKRYLSMNKLLVSL